MAMIVLSNSFGIKALDKCLVIAKLIIIAEYSKAKANAEINTASYI
ncbi:hypothetical protein GCM10011356_19420 [Kangiella profundi]|nr:hypothetical protein GCM10011356_19420 [Kangiella profundi]